MSSRTASRDSAGHASRPFFDALSARAPAFFSQTPVTIAAKEDGDPDERESPTVDEPTVQAKLTMGSPGDPFDREADATADRVVQHMSVAEVTDGGARRVQAQCAACADERIQQQAEPGQLEERVQAKASVAGMDVPGSVSRALTGSRGGGEALTPTLRDDMESAFGADFSAVRIHTGDGAQQLNRDLHARAFTYGSDIYFNSGEFRGGTHDGLHLLAHELTHVVQQGGAADSHVRLQPKSKKEATHLPVAIHFTKSMTREELTAEVMRQVFGGPILNVEHRNYKALYDVSESPVTVFVSLGLLKGRRTESRGQRSFDLDSSGEVRGAKERANTFLKGPDTPEKSALMKEIDDRFFTAVGDATRTPIKEGDAARSAMWNMIRDEVLAQHEYIANLPPQVKELIKFSTDGRKLTPADYDKLFAIAKKIERLPPGQIADYAAKVRGTTTDLDAFERSLDRYLAEQALREEQRQERADIQLKLLGLEEVYKRYRTYLTLLKSGTGVAIGGRYGGGAGAGLVVAKQADKMRVEIEDSLKEHGFNGIAQFELYIRNFEKSFERESAQIAKDLLEKYAGKLYRESERYKSSAQVSAQHQKLSGFRASFAEFDANAPIWNEYVKTKDRQRIPGQGHLHPRYSKNEADAARKKAEDAKAAAKSQFESLSEAHPVFQEEGLPLDKRIDKEKLGRANESELSTLLQQYIQARVKDIDAARAEIDGKPELIYKMDKLLPQFYAQQGIKKDSIFDLIVQDKMRSDLILKIAKGIALAVVAIALSVITFGAATPVILAAGAGIAGAGLGVYMAFEEYKEYVEEKNLAAVGFADDPSVLWVIVAVIGAGVDMAGAVRAVRALAPAAKSLNASGDVAEFTKAVRVLEQASEIEARVARAAEKAAQGRKGLSDATTELARVLGSKAYSFPGPLFDPDVYKAVVRMARNALKTGFYDAQKFVEELRLVRTNAGLQDFSPQELAKAKQAWEEANLLNAADDAFLAAEKAKVGTYTTKIKWGIQTIDARPHPTINSAFWGKRTPQTNPRVNAFELKINPADESFFLPHPKGGFVQFENLAGTTVVQDGKLIMQPKSIYHVADMPAFAEKKVLEEAARQVEAAKAAGMEVEWLVSDSKALNQLDALFKSKGISIKLTPKAE